MQEKTKQARRKVLDKHRKGDVTLHVPFDRGDMMFVKDCPICKEPGKWTAIGRFACVPCRYIFD